MRKYISSVSVAPHFALLEKELNKEEFSVFQVFNYSSPQNRIHAENDARGQLHALRLMSGDKEIVVAHYEDGEYKAVTTISSEISS